MYENIVPYDLSNTFLLLLTPEQRRSYRKEQERRSFLSPEEREAEDYADRRRWLLEELERKRRIRRIRRAIMSVVTEEDYDWFIDQTVGRGW